MSSELYEVLSLAARYLFAFLGVIIVLRSFLWLLSDRAEKHRRLRRLPDAGTVGEMVVLSGGPELPEGTSLPVPWEGELGSVRSCDIVVPCEGVHKHHLRFSYQVGTGLRILPASGCEATVDSVPLNCRSGESGAPMVHGSFLQVGSALLRLRVFAGLDSAAGFDPSSAFNTEPLPAGPDMIPPAGPEAGYMPGAPGFPPEGMQPFPGDAIPGGMMPPGPEGMQTVPVPPYPENGPAGMMPEESEGAGDSAFPPEEIREAPPRRRRADRWEEDWSE